MSRTVPSFAEEGLKRFLHGMDRRIKDLERRGEPLRGAADEYDLDDLTDVDLATTTPADGDTLVYDAALGMWLPGAGEGSTLAIGWASVTTLGTQASPTNAAWVGSPTGWTDPDAEWVWLGSGSRPANENAWLLGILDLDASHTVDIDWTVDNSGTLYVDGVSMGTTSDWTTYQTATTTLAAGRHHIAIHAQNTAASIAGAILSISDTTTGAVLFRTDEDWFVWASEPSGWPTPNPGFRLDDLTDVDTTTTPPADGDSLTFDSTLGLWVPAAPAVGGASTFSGVALRKSVTQSIPHQTFTIITWNAEDYDTDGFHDTSTNTSRITIPTGGDGYYQFGAFIEYPSNPSDGIMILLKNGVDTGVWSRISPGSLAVQHLISGPLSLVASDYVELRLRQSSGGSMSIGANGRDRFWGHKVE